MALGKGLGSLLPQKQQVNPMVASLREGITELSLDVIDVNPHQPRRRFDHTELEDLINSIKVHGIIQPLVVSPKEGGRYELIAGERRFRSAKALELPVVPVVVRNAKEQEKLEIALIENIQRKNLNAYEEALAYSRLVNEFNLTQEELAVRVGKSRSTVANTLRILTLPEEVQEAIMNEQISEGHARAIASLPTITAQLQMLKKIIENKISVREAEKEASAFKPFKSKVFDPLVIEYEEKLRQSLGTKVVLKKSGNKGEIRIPFSSLEDFKSVIDKLL